LKTIFFGAGCFWHVQEVFDCMGIGLKTEAGYMGGDENNFPNPTYKDVCSDKTGYVEIVKVEYDEAKINLEELLNKFWEIHDPTSINRQGPDVGSQYKSVIFYIDRQQRKIAKESRDEKEKELGKKIVTEIREAEYFCKAEEYHQKYYLKNGSSCKI
jgi:peptide-methionine (S)-S-oxide reductase